MAFNCIFVVFFLIELIFYERVEFQYLGKYKNSIPFLKGGNAFANHVYASNVHGR